MRFLRFTYQAEECQNIMWYRQFAPNTVIGCHTWISPDSEYRDVGLSEGVKLRVNIVTKQASPDFSVLDERIQELLREWSVSGSIGLLGAEDVTFDECIGNYSMRSRPVRDIARDLLAEEYFTVRMERDFIDEYIVPERESGEGGTEPAPIYASALFREVERIGEKCPHAEAAADDAHASFIPAHYLIEGTSQSEYRPVVDYLVDALCQAGRVPSRSVTVIDLDRMIGSNFKYSGSFEYFYECFNDAFVQSLAGGSVIVRYGTLDSDGSFDLCAYRALVRLVDAMGANPDCAQFFFIVPCGARDLIGRIERRLKVPLVEITRAQSLEMTPANSPEAFEELRRRAEEDGLVPDGSLCTCLAEHIKKDPRTNLDVIYRDWSRVKRTEDIYPAYLPLALEARNSSCDTCDAAVHRLEELIGLEGPKRRVRELLLRAEMNEELRRKGLNSVEFSRHMVFAGSPGTGKTEVARLFGEILKEKRLLSEGRLISVTGAQLVSGKMTALFEKARGSVLFIDEAYALIGASTTISELISCMENYRDEVVVILAGYRDSMEGLMGCNPGFRSRIGCFIDFPDYSEEEKVAIFDLMAARSGLVLEEDARAAVRDVVARGGTRDDEGNARFVRKLFEDACGRQQIRLALNRPDGGWTATMLRTLMKEDIEECRCPAEKRSGREELERLVGLSEVKRLVGDRLDFMRMQKARRDCGLPSSFIPMHFAFTGSPGTGKTEVARLIGRILKEEGVLSVGDMYECGKQDLVGQAVGQTAPKVAALFRRAKGSVVFIDEAYSLCQCSGGYDDEAVTAIIDQMEKLREDVVVILAGYPDEIDLLLDKNPGFRSRINAQIEFPDYSSNELCEILLSMAEDVGMSLDDAALARAHSLVDEESSRKGFGNARFVRNLFEDAVVAQGARLVRKCAEEGTRPEDLASDVLSRLEAEDFGKPELRARDGKRTIGFLA